MKKTFCLLFAAVILFGGCKDDDPAPELSVNPTSVSATAVAGAYTVAVIGNVPWTVAANAEWLTLTPTSGTGNDMVAINVAENATVDERVATVTFTAGTLSKTVAVTQESAVATLVVSPAAIDAAANAGSYTIDVTSNMAWTVASAAEWITFEPASGTGNGAITVSVAENSTTEARVANITVTTDALVMTVAVTQQLPPTPPHAATTNTWVVGEQIWSDAINVPECNKDDFSASDTEPLCRSLVYNGIRYYYYNWQYVSQNAATLCPSPWRVPAREDFVALDKALGGNGLSRMDESSRDRYVNEWGSAYGGYFDGQWESGQGSMSKYWSSSDLTVNNAYYLLINISGFINPQNNDYMSSGLLIRCVR